MSRFLWFSVYSRLTDYDNKDADDADNGDNDDNCYCKINLLRLWMTALLTVHVLAQNPLVISVYYAGNPLV